MPDGRAANQPLAATTLSPPIGAPLPGARVSTLDDRLAGQLGGPHVLGRQPLEQLLLLRRGARVDAAVDGLAQPLGELAVQLARVLAERGRQLGGQQSTAGCRPCRSTTALPSRRRNDAPALSSPPNASEPSSRPGHEPLEADRHLDQRPPEVGGDAIDQAAADQRLADARAWRASPGRCWNR